MRRFLPAFAFLFLAFVHPATPSHAEDIAVRATPLLLDGGDPARTSVGKLEWRGGVALSSDSRRFGGFSGMLIENGGRHLRAIADVGQWLIGELRYDEKGFLIGMEGTVIDNLLDPSGALMTTSKANDSESLTRLDDGRLLVGFERDHRIYAYPAGRERDGRGLAGRPRRIATPPGLEQAPENEGLEALATLKDGRILAVSENLSAGPGLVRAWIGTVQGEDVAWQPIAYRVKAPFQPTGAGLLPNGDVIMTERTFNPIQGVRVRVTRIKGETIRPGATLEPEELAFLAAPVITENLESVDALPLADGKTGIWIIADDNFNKGLQRTILLHFVLKE